MYKRLLLLSNFVLIINLQIVYAQNTFFKVFEKDHFDYTSGITESTQQHFYMLATTNKFERVIKLDVYGNLLWDKNISPNAVNRCFLEINEGSYFLAGYKSISNQWPQINISQIRLINKNGVSIKDTAFRYGNDSNAGVLDAIKLSDKDQICALVQSGERWDKNLSIKMLFIDSLGSVKVQSSIPVPLSFSAIKIFKRATKDEYFVFGNKALMRIDSAGQMIDTISAVPDENYSIKSICQFQNGTFVSLATYLYDGRCLIYYDENGVMIDFQIVNFDRQKYFNSINITKEQGVILAGSHLLLLDSLKRQVWIKDLFHKDSAEVISIGQSFDGGFYGCGHNGPSFRLGVYDLFVFKTGINGEMTGLSDSRNNLLNVEITPNPSNGLIKITGISTETDLAIMNPLGQQMFPSQKISAETVLDASSLNNGIYILVLSSPIGSYIQKLNISK